MLKILPDSELSLDEAVLKAKREEYFSWYRELHPELFSDTEIVYETQLTPVLFEWSLSKLSEDKKHSLFENFVLAVAARLITPNIKPQTGPDAGGDGKVDGETYPVDSAISDKWWVSEGSAGDQRWAIAISVQKDWARKVDGDVKKAVKTGRGYTKVLFFTNQKIQSRIRLQKEDELLDRYGIPVSIFDGSWLSFAVFKQDCLDLALKELAFPEEYLKKTVNVGPMDKKRQEELERLENSFLTRTIAPIDTNYVDDLLETCQLSRGLARPKLETEGRFQRALNASRNHGSPKQSFRITYCHALTSFLWFYDIGAMCSDYCILKEYAFYYPTVQNLECITTILSLLIGVSTSGFFGVSGLDEEVSQLKELRKNPDLDDSCQLYIELFFCQQKLVQHIGIGQDITDDIHQLSSYLSKCADYPDVSFEYQAQVVDSLSRIIADNPAFEDLVDTVAKISSERGSAFQAAMIHFSRSKSLIKKGNYLSTIRHLVPCIRSFNLLGCEDLFIMACDMMGKALYHRNLLFASKVFHVYAASSLIQKSNTLGSISPLLITILYRLCDIELLLGQLVMFLNWQVHLFALARDGQLRDSKIEEDSDIAWACHLAVSDISDPVFEILPPILDRNNLPLSAIYLKAALGHLNEFGSHLESFEAFHNALLKRDFYDQLQEPLSISTEGLTTLSTQVIDCRFTVVYENGMKNRILSETILASIEFFFSTFAEGDVVALDKEIRIKMIETKEGSSFVQGSTLSEYLFHVNYMTLGDVDLSLCLAKFFCLFLEFNVDWSDETFSEASDLLAPRAFLDRLTLLLQYNVAVYQVFGKGFKFSIDRWKVPDDKSYRLVSEPRKRKQLERPIGRHPAISVYKISSQVYRWDDAGWNGVRLKVDEHSSHPPVMEFLFLNKTVGKQLAGEMRELMKSQEQRIEIQLVKGIDREHPSRYSICVAPKVPKDEIIPGSKIIAVCRSIIMDSDIADDPGRFEQAFSRFDKCLVTARVTKGNKRLSAGEVLMPPTEFANVIITDAWRVSPTDSTRFSITPVLNPVIPKEYEKTAPVLELLEELRGMK